VTLNHFHAQAKPDVAHRCPWSIVGHSPGISCVEQYEGEREVFRRWSTVTLMTAESSGRQKPLSVSHLFGRAFTESRTMRGAFLGCRTIWCAARSWLVAGLADGLSD